MKRPFSSLWCAAALASLTAGFACAQNAKPDAEGYIRDWLMLAAIPVNQDGSGADYIVKDQVANEATLKPKAGDKVKVQDKEYTWKAVQAKEAGFDFNETLGTPQENVAGYLVAYVVCEKDFTEVTLLIGCNDQGRVYLNGKEVFKHIDPGALEKDLHKVEKLTLNKGVNVVVFKVINETNNWQASLRFADKTGKPVTDYAIKLAP